MAREFRLLFLLLFVVACIGQTASLAGQGNANSIQTPTSTTTTASTSIPSTTQTPTYTTTTASISIPSTTQTPTTTKTASTSSPSTTQTPTTTKTASTSIPSTTQTPTTTTGSGGVSTATVPATTKPPGPCESNPCGHGSTCEPRVGHTFTCLCLAGDYYNNKSNICERAKVFPGQLNLTMIYDDKMADNKSTEFKIASENITAALDDVYKDSVTGYTGSTVLELRSKEKSKFWSRSGKKVTASVEIIFKIDSDITASEVETQIKTASNFSDGVLGDATFTETSLCDKGPCDEKTTTCLSENGLFNCTCSINYIPTDFSSRVCFACPTGQKASRSECVDCPFGYSGFNCNESWKLALVIVGSVLGGLLLITLILLPVVACKSSNKSSRKSKDVDIVEPYVSHSPAKAPLVNSSLANSRAPSINNGPANGLGSFANAGAPRIPRASTASNWDRKIDLEMTPSSSRQSLIPAGRNTPLYEDTDAMNSNPYAQVRPPSSLYAQVRPQSSPYAQTRPQNNLYAQNRPQSNPYASSQGQTNPYYIHDDGRRFN